MVVLSELPGSTEEASGSGVDWLELSGTGDDTAESFVLLGVVELSTGVVFTDAGETGTLALIGVPPGQRELRGKCLQRIPIPSGDILISVGELIDESLDSESRDLLDSAIATLVVSTNIMTVPIRVRDFPFILKLTSRSTEHFAN